uniref:Bifunctional inhibitor/plant lipid transfer protein/seed storage helical domain-containing protein n=1 Tax=Chenopodium quinoa TaxID=63459 RepID=A0A803MT19_CHEQI
MALRNMGMTTMVIIMLIISMFWAGVSAQPSCPAALTSLTPCLSFSVRNSSTPSSSCCSELANMLQTAPVCLCNVLNGVGGELLEGFLDRTLASALPSACNMQTQSRSQCDENDNFSFHSLLVQRLAGKPPVKVLEAMAARIGLQVARELGYGRVELESDVLIVTNLIRSSKEGMALLDLVIDDIRSMSREFDSFDCVHIKRVGNCVAYLMARQYPPDGFEQLYVDNFPQGVVSLAELDVG